MYYYTINELLLAYTCSRMLAKQRGAAILRTAFARIDLKEQAVGLPCTDALRAHHSCVADYDRSVIVVVQKFRDRE